jgi:hypothetical protein
MTARRWISTGLIGTLLIALSPATTWAAGPGQPQQATPAAALHVAIAHAAADAAGNPSLQLRIPAQQRRSGARMQSTGGGHTGMILGIVGSLVGVAATVYMVKQMQKTTNQITNQNNQ